MGFRLALKLRQSILVDNRAAGAMADKRLHLCGSGRALRDLGRSPDDYSGGNLGYQPGEPGGASGGFVGAPSYAGVLSDFSVRDRKWLGDDRNGDRDSDVAEPDTVVDHAVIGASSYLRKWRI